MVATPQKIQEIEVVDIPINEIKVTNRLRAISEEKVEELVESIQLVGMLHPLVVSKQEDGYLLLSGNHRISALRKLNRTTAPCTLHSSDETIGKLVEIAENLIRSELCQISICQHIVMRENLLTKLGKRAKSGDHRWNKTGITSEQLAKSMDMDRRAYLRKKSVAKNLHPKVQDLLIGTQWSRTFSDVLALSQQPEDVQLMVANMLVEGRCKGFKRALTLSRIKCISFDWNEEQTRVKDLIGNPKSVMRFDGESSPLSQLCKLVSHDEECRVIKRTWGTETAPNYAQHPDHSAYFINFYSNVGDTVADVMCGRGTNVLVGSALGRKMIGYDLSHQNLKTIRSAVLEHTDTKESDLTLHHSCGVELKEYEGQENIWDMVTFDPPYIFQRETYGDDPRDLCHLRDLDQFNAKLETCLRNLKRLIKPSNWEKRIFHPIVIKVGSARDGKNGITDMATEVEMISRKLDLKVHDKVMNVLNSQWAMFNVSRCIDNRYSIKVHESNLVLVKY